MQKQHGFAKGLEKCERYQEYIRFRPGVLAFRLHVASILLCKLRVAWLSVGVA